VDIEVRRGYHQAGALVGIILGATAIIEQQFNPAEARLVFRENMNSWRRLE
jgi:hypothetical protein